MNTTTKSLLALSIAVATLAGFERVREMYSGVQSSPLAQQAAVPAVVASRPPGVSQRAKKTTTDQLQQRYQQFMANRPAYLADVDLPGGYSIDTDGNLIVDAGMKEMLDFFFLAVGDLSFDQIHDLIAGSMISDLREPARSQALDFLDRYFSYVESYDQWQQSFDKNDAIANDPTDMQRRLGELESLRRQQLGDEAYEAFFEESDRINSAYLQAQVALRQPNLTDTDKAAIREQLTEALPPEVRRAQEASMALVTLEQKVGQLKVQGASETEIFQARAGMVGEEAARRLAQVDQEQDAWTQKRDQYRQLAQVPGLEVMDPQERQNHIADIAQQQLGLNANEVKRMQALDRIEAAEAVP